MMIKTIVLSAMMLMMSIGAFAQTIDTKKSTVTFEISNMKVNTVEGSFTGLKGTVNFDASKLSTSSFEVCIDASTVDTDNTKRDDHLRNEDFFHVEKYPTICFASTSIIKDGKGFKAKGDLTMLGITKEVVLPFTYENNQLTGALALNRFDYKLGEGTGSFMVGEEVKIQINCVLK